MLRLPEENISVVNPDVDPRFTPGRVRSPHPLVVAAGRLVPVKRFEMLVGQLPYPVGSVQQTFWRHRSDPPADIRAHVGALPAGLVTLVERLLARKPADRPRAGALVQQLIGLEIAALRRRLSA